MQWSMNGGGLGGSNPDVIAQVYKTLVGQKRLSTYLNNDITWSASNTLTQNIYIARNITLNAGVTMTGQSAAVPLVIICDTLTVNGVLSAGTYNQGGGSQSGSGAGGNGGRTLIIFARQILGTGTISSNGSAGGNGVSSTASSTYYTGVGGNSPYVPWCNGGSPSGGGIAASAAAGGTAAIGSTGGVVTFGTINELLLRFPTWLQGGYNVFNGTNYNWIGGNGYAGSGGSGTSINGYATAEQAGGGGGGASVIANGGAGGYNSQAASVNSTGGGGGGAGGNIYIFTESAFPSITLQVMGGAGGNAYGSYSGAGGGGAGGYIGLWCPVGSPASTATQGGSAGTQTGGTAAVAGGNGDFDQFTFAA